MNITNIIPRVIKGWLIDYWLFLFGFNQTVDGIDFLEGVNLICFFAKKQIKFTPSKKSFYHPEYSGLPTILDKKKPSNDGSYLALQSDNT